MQLYFANILPPGEYEGTRFNSPKKRVPEEDDEDDYEEEFIRIGKGESYSWKNHYFLLFVMLFP